MFSFRVMMTAPLNAANAALPGGDAPAHVALAQSLAQMGADVVVVMPPWGAEIPYTSRLFNVVDLGERRFTRFRAAKGFNWITIEPRTQHEKKEHVGLTPKGELSGRCVRSLLKFSYDAFEIPQMFGLKPDVVLLNGVNAAFLPVALEARASDDFLLAGVKTVFMRGGRHDMRSVPVSRDAISSTGLSEDVIRRYRINGAYDLIEGAIKLADHVIASPFAIGNAYSAEQFLASLKQFAGFSDDAEG